MYMQGSRRECLDMDFFRKKCSKQEVNIQNAQCGSIVDKFDSSRSALLPCSLAVEYETKTYKLTTFGVKGEELTTALFLMSFRR